MVDQNLTAKTEQSHQVHPLVEKSDVLLHHILHVYRPVLMVCTPVNA